MPEMSITRGNTYSNPSTPKVGDQATLTAQIGGRSRSVSNQRTDPLISSNPLADARRQSQLDLNTLIVVKAGHPGLDALWALARIVASLFPPLISSVRFRMAKFSARNDGNDPQDAENALMDALEAGKALDPTKDPKDFAFEMDQPKIPSVKTILKYFKKFYGKDFKREFIKVRGKNAQFSITKEITVGDKTYTEESKNLSLNVGRQYVNSAADSVPSAVQVFNSYLAQEKAPVRLSALRGGVEESGTLVNGREHTFTDQEGNTRSILRSGAFTMVHSKEITNPNQKVHLLRAQALPKLFAALNKMVNNESAFEMAKKTGAFIYLEESLVTIGDKKEGQMVQDMQDLFKDLGENALIQLVGDKNIEGAFLDNNGKVVIRLFKEEANGALYFFKPKLMVTGINIAQVGRGLFNSKSLRKQDAVNQQALKEILDYADSSADANVQILKQAVRAHYSADNKRRKLMDVEGIDKVNALMDAMGMTIGTSCKSGKDRTSGAVIHYLTRNVKENEQKVKDALFGGVSLQLAGQSKGGYKKEYAIDAAVHQATPKAYRAPKKYLNKTMPF
jgi:hypothetical protein